jgi:TonB dependent receptor
VTDSAVYIPSGSFLGHHEIKGGSSWQYMFTITADPNGLHGDYQLVFQTVGGIPGVPVSLRAYNFPVSSQTNLNDGGFYAQDSWKVLKNLTVNVGLRFDMFHAWVPPQSKVQGQFGPPWNTSVTPAAGTTQSLPYIQAGTWQSPAPRVGVVWDIFGNGKTVLKGSYGRYNWTPGDDFATPFNQNTGTITTFKWTPTTGAGSCTEALALAAQCDYVAGSVNLDPNGPAFQSVAASSGTLPNTAINPGLAEQYTNNYQLFAEHELAPNLSFRLGFTYVQNRNTWQQIPIQIPYSAWDIPYTVHDQGSTIAPCLPNGTTTCSQTGPAFTIYDLDPAYKGTAFSETEYENRPTNRDDFYRTMTAVLTKRPTSDRWSITASYTLSKVHRWITGGSFSPIQTNPNELYFPVDTSWNWQSRITGVYRLPWKFEVAGIYELFNGLQGQRVSAYTLPNSGSLMLPVEPFGAEESPMRALLNMRFARDFHADRIGTFRPSVELLNGLNSAAPWAETYTTGPTFGKYTTTDTPRIFRFGLVYSF